MECGETLDLIGEMVRRLHITSFRRIYEVVWTQLDNGLKKEASRLLSFEK